MTSDVGSGRRTFSRAAGLGCALLVAIPTIGLAAPAQDDPMAEARRLFAADRFAEAGDLLGRIVEARPDDGAARLLLGRTLLVLGDLEGAERNLLAAADMPATEERFMVPHTLGLVELRRRRHAEAERRFDEAIEIAPLYSGARIARAQARAFLGDTEGALADLDAVRESPRPQPAAEVLAGELLLALDDPEAAFARFATVGDAAGDTPAAENAAMYLGTFAADPAETETRILRGMGRVLGRPQPWFWLAVVRRSAGDPATAAAALRVALSIDELHAPSWILLRALPGAPADLESAIGAQLPGLEYRLAEAGRGIEAGDVDRAEDEVADLLTARPRLVPAHLLRAEIARRRGQPVGMLAALGDLLETAPWLVSVHAERALLAREIGALPLAEREARAAVRLLPADGSLRFLLATVLMASGQAAGAAAEAEAALARDYDLAPVRVLLGNAYQELQRVPEAVEQLALAVAADPGVAEEIAGFALNALAATGSDRVRDALEAARTASPDGPNVLYALGALHLRRGETERAIEAFERLLELVPGRSEIHYNLAAAYRRAGREADAAEQERLFRELKAVEDRTFERANETYRRRTEAVAALAAGDASRAVELLERVVGTTGSSPDDRTLLGSALMAAGRPRDAAAAYTRVLEGAPFDVAALCGAVAAARDLGEPANELRARLAAVEATCPGTE